MASNESSQKGGRVGGGVLYEQVSQAVEFGGRLCHPLRPLDVGED